MKPGSSLFLFSDGVFDVTDQDGREWDLPQVLSMLPGMAAPDGLAPPLPGLVRRRTKLRQLDGKQTHGNRFDA